MIKALQKKFIVTAMIAITVLLLVLLGMIKAVNAWSTEQQSDRMLAMLLDNEISLAPQRPPDMREERGFLAPPLTEDQAMSAVYFWVRVSNSGMVTKMDVSRIASVAETEAEEMALQAYGEARDSGKIRHFKYRAAATPNGSDTVFVFLDTSTQTYSVLRVLTLSALAGMVCWLLMLLLVILLSKKAIRPIAVNLEKQKQFITDAGHEIKTPLAIILANTDAMELHSGVSKWSQNIRTQTVRLNGLMQNLLTLAKLDESNAHLYAEDISLSQLLEDSLRPFKEAAELKGIPIQKEIQPGVAIHANRDSITRLISILWIMPYSIRRRGAGSPYPCNWRRNQPFYPSKTPVKICLRRIRRSCLTDFTGETARERRNQAAMGSAFQRRERSRSSTGERSQPATKAKTGSFLP